MPSEPSASASSSASSSSSLPANGGGTFTFVCPSCGTVTELPESLLGRKVECRMCFEEHVAEATTERQCPFCGGTVKYHAAVCKFCKADLTRTPPESAPAKEDIFLFICPECDAVAELPVSQKNQQYECKVCCETVIAVPAEERKCPHCGGKIKIQATICKHCKKNVSPLAPGATRSGIAAHRPGISAERSLSPSPDKTAGKALLWSLLWPGIGQIYLGQIGKGILIALVFLPIIVVIGVLLPAFLSHLICAMLYAWIIGDAFTILTKQQIGESVGEWEFSPPGGATKRISCLSPEMQKSVRSAGIAAIVCLILGLSGPGILSLLCLIAN